MSQPSFWQGVRTAWRTMHWGNAHWCGFVLARAAPWIALAGIALLVLH